MKEKFISNLEAHFKKNLEEITPLQRIIRQKAWDRFLELGLAEKKQPGYQYFPLSQFYQESFEREETFSFSKEQVSHLVHPESHQSYLLFINGQYAPEFSDVSGLPEGVVAMRLRDALNTYGNFLQGRLSRTITEETDPFATLNIALIQMGLFIYVPPNIQVDLPIQCIHLISSDKPLLMNPRIHFFLGRHSKVKWIYEHCCMKDFDYFSNGVVDLALEEGAQFEQYGTLNPCPQGWCFEATRVTLKRNSRFQSLTSTSGTKAVRQDFRIALAGENSSCDLKGLSLLSDHKQSHVNVLVDHQAPHCQSNQLFKNILSGSSRSSFEGKILIQSNAEKSEAYQLNNNLLIDPKAIANSKPNLEIFADDVKASHGATVAQLKQEDLHYLKTRGISEEVGKKLLLSGFYLDMLNQISLPWVKEKMQQLAHHLSV